MLNQPVGYLEAGEARHLDVKKQHVGRKPFDDADRFKTIAGLADHLDIVDFFEHVAQLFARELLIVDDDGFHWHKSYRRPATGYQLPARP